MLAQKHVKEDLEATTIKELTLKPMRNGSIYFFISE
jgi:hypothetical protein